MQQLVGPAVWLLGGVLGFALACTVIAEPVIEPCENGANNYISSTGMCLCQAGYEFCDPNDPMNLDCCEAGTGTGTGTGTDSGTETGLEMAMPCESGMNNKLDENGDCLCQLGFEWCNPNDPQDLNCCEIGSSTAPPG